MVQQLQLFECETLHRNGNTALKLLLSRLPQGSLTVENARAYCQKIPSLGVQDIKDILFEAKTSQILPEIVGLLFAIPCENHQQIYQKSLANIWVNRSFDSNFMQSATTHSLSACRLIAEWKNLGLIEVQRNVKVRIWNLMLELNSHDMQAIKDSPMVVSLFFDLILESEHTAYSAVKAANFLNHVADVLSDQQCNTAQHFFENLKLWNSIPCENLHAKIAQIQKKTLLEALGPSQRPSIARKI